MKKEEKEKDNRLELKKLASIIEPNPSAYLEPAALKDWNNLIKAQFGGGEPEYAVFYLDYGIRFARWEGDKLKFYEDKEPDARYLQLARIFNQERELKIWQENGAFRYRRRIDGKGKMGEVIEAKQFLWGTHADSLPGEWTRLWEDRGTEIFLPISIEEIKPFKHNEKDFKYDRQLVWLKTRNYIDYLDNCQATFVDCRFVGFETIAEKDIREFLRHF